MKPSSAWVIVAMGLGFWALLLIAGWLVWMVICSLNAQPN